MVIGDRLKQIREAKDLSQGDVEKETGLLRSYISRVENGHTTPSLETLEKLSNALGVSMAQLFAGNGKEPQPAYVVVEKSAPRLGHKQQNRLRRICAAFGKMSARDRVLLESIAVKMAGKK